MPTEIDTLKLIEHMDAKFRDADEKRREGLNLVHQKIDAHSKEARESLADFSRETTATLGGFALKIGNHDMRIEAVERHRSAGRASWSSWIKLIAAGILGGVSSWLVNRFGAAQ